MLGMRLLLPGSTLARAKALWGGWGGRHTGISSKKAVRTDAPLALPWLWYQETQLLGPLSPREGLEHNAQTSGTLNLGIQYLGLLPYLVGYQGKIWSGQLPFLLPLKVMYFFPGHDFGTYTYPGVHI